MQRMGKEGKRREEYCKKSELESSEMKEREGKEGERKVRKVNERKGEKN